MEARQNDVESRTGDFNPFETEQHADSNEGSDGPSYPCQPHSALPDELLYRPHQLLELEEEGSDDDDEIRVRDIPKPKQTARSFPEGTGNTTGRPPLVATSATPDSSRRQHATPSVGCHNLSEATGLNLGDVSARGMVFAPFKLIKRYPFSYVGKSNQDQVLAFFNKNLLQNRVWDFFFIVDPAGSKDPLLLVPSVQFQQFLSLISDRLGRNLTIPQGPARKKFFLSFGSFDTPLPRFLGHVDSAEAYEGLRGKWAGFPPDDLSILPAAAIQAFQDKVAMIYTSCRSSSKKNPELERMKRIERQKQFSRVTKRVQRYLGLRARAVYASHSGSVIGWNVEKLAPFINNSSVRFTCVDVEAYERNSDVITEVGIALLDTEDIMDVPPGVDGANWFTKIETFHLRVSEYAYITNHEFVHGCPDSFNFGKSERVPSKDLARRIGSIIGDNTSEDNRPVILVGHGIANDLTYLKKIGYNVWRVPQFLDEVDTQSMFRRLQRSPNGRSLESVCRELGHPGYDFHNAGNDAYYTLQSMTVMALRQMVNPPTPESLGDDIPDLREWSDGEVDDGGLPQKSNEPTRQPSPVVQQQVDIPVVKW